MSLDWNRLGPREKGVLAILREHDGSLATREVLSLLREQGVDVAYTTVGTVLERLAEKGVIGREEELHAGSMRYRYRFEPAVHREALVEDVVDDVDAVLGERGLALLQERAERARTDHREEVKG